MWISVSIWTNTLYDARNVDDLDPLQSVGDTVSDRKQWISPNLFEGLAQTGRQHFADYALFPHYSGAESYSSRNLVTLIRCMKESYGVADPTETQLSPTWNAMPNLNVVCQAVRAYAGHLPEKWRPSHSAFQGHSRSPTFIQFDRDSLIIVIYGISGAVSNIYDNFGRKRKYFLSAILNASLEGLIVRIL